LTWLFLFYKIQLNNNPSAFDAFFRKIRIYSGKGFFGFLYCNRGMGPYYFEQQERQKPAIFFSYLRIYFFWCIASKIINIYFAAFFENAVDLF